MCSQRHPRPYNHTTGNDPGVYTYQVQLFVCLGMSTLVQKRQQRGKQQRTLGPVLGENTRIGATIPTLSQTCPEVPSVCLSTEVDKTAVMHLGCYVRKHCACVHLTTALLLCTQAAACMQKGGSGLETNGSHVPDTTTASLCLMSTDVANADTHVGCSIMLPQKYTHMHTPLHFNRHMLLLLTTPGAKL